MKKILEVIKKVIIVVFIISISIAICMRSELNPISKRVPTIDSDVYIYIGEQLNNGKVIYKDIFDHKGPLFHFIEFIGIKMSFQRYIGVWIIELISLILTFTFFYKTAQIITKNRLLSMLVLFMTAVQLSVFFINGNYPEEYSLLFISIGLYYIVKYFANDNLPTKKIYVIEGFCFSCVALIKLNLVSIWVVFILIILIKMIKEKQWKELKQAITYFSIGLIIPMIISIIVLLLQQNLVECFQQYIMFNFKYATNTEGSLSDTLEKFISKIYCLSVIACLVEIIYQATKKKRKLALILGSFIYLFIALWIVVMPRNEYAHYGIILTPTYVVPLSFLLKDITAVLRKNKNFIVAILTVFILFFMVLNVTRKNIVEYKKDVRMVNSERFRTKENEMIKYIKNHTNVDDNILVLGNECNIYLMSERSCNCKYVYQIPIVRIDPTIMEETIHEIITKKPKLIVLKLTNYEEVQNSFYEYLKEYNQYQYVETFYNYEIYLLENNI